MIVRRIILIFIFMVFAGCSSDQNQIDYKSSYGFSTKLSKDWLILTKDQIKINPQIFDIENKAFKGVNKAMLTQIKNNILVGKTEIMYNTKGTGSGFGDNINVMVTMGNLVKKTQENQLCTQMPQAFKKMFGRSIKFYECGLKKVGNIKALHLNFDGVVQGTRSVQYQFQTGPRKLVIATLTCKNSNYEKLNKEFNDFIRNIKRDQ